MRIIGKKRVFSVILLLALAAGGFWALLKVNESKKIIYSDILNPCLLIQDSISKRNCFVEKIRETSPDKALLTNPTSKTPKKLKSSTIYEDSDLKIIAQTLPKKNKASGKFVKQYGPDHGIIVEHQFTGLEWESTFVMGRGIASGDFNNDNWPDLVLASSAGPLLYKNAGDFQFYYIPFDLPSDLSADAIIVAFVDINNDGWEDIYVSTFGGENYFVMNDQNDFATINIVKIPKSERLLTQSAAFADIDHDGDLDLFQGNWTDMYYLKYKSRYSKNELFINNFSSFELQHLEEWTGETLTALFSDIDGDGYPELFAGNDFDRADSYYRLNSDKTAYELINLQTSVIDHTTFNTMSIETGDLNNDLVLDLFLTDMAFTEEGDEEYCSFISNEKFQLECVKNLDLRDKKNRLPPDYCLTLEGEYYQQICLASANKYLAGQQQDQTFCENIPDHYASYKRLCYLHAESRAEANAKNIIPASPENPLPQRAKNILFLSNGEGQYTEKAEELNIHATNWSWSGKMADLTNDGWLDIYIGNGYAYKPSTPNVFLENKQGKDFSRIETEVGLDDYLHTPSFTYADFDRDGDLDIIMTGINAPIRIYENQLNNNQSITFSLNDITGNSKGIGTKLIITDASGNSQLREVKLSGAYISFDNPVAHFGLGDENEISRLEILWADGTIARVETEMTSNKHYLIERK